MNHIVTIPAANDPFAPVAGPVDTRGATLILLAVAGLSTPTVSDSEGNTWNLRESIGTLGVILRLYECANPTTAEDHTFSGGGTFGAIGGAAGSALAMDNLSHVRNEKRGMRDAVRESHTWIMALLYIGTFGSFIGFGFAFGQVLQVQFSDVFSTPVKAAYLTFLGPLLGSLIRPVGGALADRLGGARVTFVNFIAMAAGAEKKSPPTASSARRTVRCKPSWARRATSASRRSRSTAGASGEVSTRASRPPSATISASSSTRAWASLGEKRPW